MNCKIGDIAIIIGVRDERCSANIGAMVTVLDRVLTDGPLEWKVGNPSRPLLLFSEMFPDWPVAEGKQEWAWALDRHLMPINPPAAMIAESAAESENSKKNLEEEIPMGI